MSTIHTLPPVLERYELKYLIPSSYIEPITDFISLYCLLDDYSLKAEPDDYFYKVGSLYFDSPGFEFLKQRIGGKEIRFNMRARFYGDGDKAPYFLEIKHRNGISGVVTKYRATAQEEQWPHILTDPAFRPDTSEPSAEQANKELFLRLATTYAIEPKILTTYQRRAFFSVIDEYARVTIDIRKKYRIQNDYELINTYGMTHYDNETIYGVHAKTEANAVLELKCPVGAVPFWILDLIRKFELQHQGFSKYASSVLVHHFDNGDWYMPFDREANIEFSGRS